MPVFIVHGFRWDRVKIRHHVILNDVDDAASDYIMQSTTPDALRASFTKMFPEIMAVLPNVQFLEQYDPEDCSDDAHAQPYAYIADYIIKSDLSVDIAEVISKGPGGNTASWQAMADLSDKVAQGAPIRWYAVYNGDVERVGNQTLRPQDVGRASKVGYRRKKEHGDRISAVVEQGFGLVEELRITWARQIQCAIKGELQGSSTD